MFPVHSIYSRSSSRLFVLVLRIHIHVHHTCYTFTDRSCTLYIHVCPVVEVLWYMCCPNLSLRFSLLMARALLVVSASSGLAWPRSTSLTLTTLASSVSCCMYNYGFIYAGGGGGGVVPLEYIQGVSLRTRRTLSTNAFSLRLCSSHGS